MSLDEDDKLLYQAILSNFCKPLLKLLSDNSEKIRELTLLTLKTLLENCDTVSQFLPYVLPVIAYRVNCHDLEGVLHLPEVQRPPPTSKPTKIVALVEPTEEVTIIFYFLN